MRNLGWSILVLCGYAAAGLGVYLHTVTVVLASNTFGLIIGTIALSCPVVSEVLLFFYVAAKAGSGHPFVQLCVGYGLFVFVLVIGVMLGSRK